MPISFGSSLTVNGDSPASGPFALPSSRRTREPWADRKNGGTWAPDFNRADRSSIDFFRIAKWKNGVGAVKSCVCTQPSNVVGATSLATTKERGLPPWLLSFLRIPADPLDLFHGYTAPLTFGFPVCFPPSSLRPSCLRSFPLLLDRD